MLALQNPDRFPNRVCFVTSHISVSSSSAPQGSTGLSNSGKAGSSGGLGAFGAILDSLAGAGTGTASASTATTGFTQDTGSSSTSTGTTGSDSGIATILDLIEKLLGQSTGATALNTTQTDAATGTAAAADANAASAANGTSDAGTPPKLLKDVLDALKKLSDAQQSGQPVDDNLLKKAKQAIDALQAYLAGQQPLATTVAAATPDPTTATTAGTAAVGAVGNAAATPPSDGTKAGAARAAQLETARASLGVLSSKLEQLSSATTKLAPELATKLDALAKSLDPTKLTADTLDQLGLTGSTSASDPKLAAAINGLANGKPQAAAATPPLGMPQLKVPDGSALSTTSDSKSKPTGLSPGSAGTATGPNTGLKPIVATAGKNGADNGSNASGQGQDKSAAAAVANATAATNTPADASTRTDGSGSAAVAAAGINTAASAATARLAQSIYQAAPTTQVNLPQMAYEIVRNVQQGTNHFQIKLDPADLGRVDVKLAIDSTGAVNARLTVERPETLDLLRRDQSQLGQALTQAGLDTSKTNLQFSLSQNPFTRQDNGSANSGGSYTSSDGEDDTAIASIDTARSASVYSGSVSSSGLNLFV